MATAALCGSTGSVSGPAAVTEVTKWDITITKDILEATSFDSNGWKERVACLKGATGTFESIGQPSTVGTHAGCQFKTAQVGGLTIAGDILIKNIAVTTAVDGIVTFTHDFSFTGTVTCASLI